MLPKRIKDKITREIPRSLIKERDGGKGVTLSYISGSTVIDMLNDAFDYEWDWIVEKEWQQESQPKFNEYSKVPDNEKVFHKGKKGSWEEQPPVIQVRGHLVARFIDDNGKERTITKTGIGSKVLVGGASEQESAFKAAGTDALKKAASLLGIGAQLYRDEDEAMYFYEINYEDPWTKECLEEHKEDREYIESVIEEYELDENGLLQVLSDYEDEISSFNDIVPDNIKNIVNFLKLQIEAIKSQEDSK